VFGGTAERTKKIQLKTQGGSFNPGLSKHFSMWCFYLREQRLSSAAPFVRRAIPKIAGFEVIQDLFDPSIYSLRCG
jgi:hypothetical protein